MTLFSKRNLHYADYAWSAYPHNDPHINGKPDDTPFNRTEGNEVVYLVNRLMIQWDYRFANTGNKIEKLIHDKLPADILQQEEVQDWVKLNLTF
jgi:hypothetical protein